MLHSTDDASNRFANWRTRPQGKARILWLVLACAACGDEPGTQGTIEAVGSGEEAGVSSARACQEEKPAAACGSSQHCIDGVCVDNLCGDGIRAGSEQCDDGNQATGDGCTPSCNLRPVTCGDTNLDEGEECDDGNWFDVDPCSNDCMKNECGNAREDALEECDDGNLVDGDGCSNQCTENRCRNGRLDPGEECDDGNREHRDGCSNGCLVVVCGDGKVDGEARGGREECDDGNSKNDDACSNACTTNFCGNMRVDPGEVCDGDTSQYGCSDNCRERVGNTACNDCRRAFCTEFAPLPEDPATKIDALGGCLENPDTNFRDQCTAVIDCAQIHACGYDATGLIGCFCGTADAAACQIAGTANGPCQSEIYAAARTEVLADVLGGFQATEQPSGMAYFLVACETRHCLEECGP